MSEWTSNLKTTVKLQKSKKKYYFILFKKQRNKNTSWKVQSFGTISVQTQSLCGQLWSAGEFWLLAVVTDWVSGFH